MPEAGAFGTLTGRAEMAQHLLERVRAAKSELALYSHELDHRLYGSAEFAGALKDFLLSSDKTRLRLLVENPQPAVRGNARLVELFRRLSSRVDIRQLPAEHKPTRDDRLICDGRHIFERLDPGNIEARWFDDAPLKARDLLKAYDGLWHESVVAREFTDLKI